MWGIWQRMGTYLVTEIHWINKLAKTRAWALDITWHAHLKSTVLGWGLWITWRQQLLGQVTAMQQWSSTATPVLPRQMFCFTSCHFIHSASLVRPTKHTFFFCPNNHTASLSASWEYLSYLGAKGLQSTCSTFPQHPRVKGFTPPRNLPVTWKCIEDRPLAIEKSSSNPEKAKNKHTLLWPYSPSQTVFLWMHFSLLL